MSTELKPLTRDDTEHGKEYFEAEAVRAALATVKDSLTAGQAAELPPLPEPRGTAEIDCGYDIQASGQLIQYVDAYTADQMHAYAEQHSAALRAELEALQGRDLEAFERGREIGRQQERALWQLAESTREIEAMEDARRYRALRASLALNAIRSTEMPCVSVPLCGFTKTYTPEGLDAAIDAALSTDQAERPKP